MKQTFFISVANLKIKNTKLDNNKNAAAWRLYVVKGCIVKSYQNMLNYDNMLKNINYFDFNYN